MRFGITANPEHKHALEATREAVRLLKGSHYVLLEDALAKAFRKRGRPLEDIKADIILAIGGDGTVLRALQRTCRKVLGINAGSVGFLAEGDPEHLSSIIDRLVSEDYRLEERLRLKVTIDGKRFHDCLNEVVVHTAQVAKIRHYEIRVDGAVAEQVRADGIIIATPTGSTSYSMSAGGPILDPRVRALVVAAIAPFKPSFHPFVVPVKSKIQVSFVRPRPGLVVFDGQQEIPLQGNEKVLATQSDRPAKLIRFGDNFYSRIQEKLANP